MLEIRKEKSLFSSTGVCNSLLPMLRKLKIPTPRRGGISDALQHAAGLALAVAVQRLEERGLSLTETGRHLGVFPSAIAKTLYRSDKHMSN